MQGSGVVTGLTSAATIWVVAAIGLALGGGYYVEGLGAALMPLGLLLDSVALSDSGWRSVTVSRGSLASLRRVHTRNDSLEHLRGDGISRTARVLARAAEALAR